MSITILDREINNVCIIDDDADSRYGWGLTVEDTKLNPISQDEKVNSIDEYLALMTKQCDAIVTDHHLKIKDYFPVNGAEIVYKCFDYKIPSILVTRYENAVVDEIRKYRPKIPIILSPDDFDPDSLMQGLEICINEFKGTFTQEREPIRTLVRVDDVSENHIYILMPGWNPNEMVSVNKNILPHGIFKELKPDTRLFALVNTGAANSRDLYFSNWELK